jgi:hypothetical protein
MSGADSAWDVFISHASEDKDSLVRPLATELSRLGLRVWYDEFSLRIGDSLSASIDKGLGESNAGVVVISPSFIVKSWPKRELAGLVAGHMGRSQLILPIWFNVSRDDVLSFSPTLADTIAIDATGIDLSELALRILERVKPELHMAFQRRLAYEKTLAKGETKFVNPSDLSLNGPIRHENFDFATANRIRLIHSILLEVFPVEWSTTVDNFRKDMHPEEELELWEYVASIYATVVNEFKLDYAARQALYLKLLERILGVSDTWEPASESPEWEHRAQKLSSKDIDPISDDFGPRVTFPVWAEPR